MHTRAPYDSALRSSSASESARDTVIARERSSVPMIRRVLYYSNNKKTYSKESSKEYTTVQEGVQKDTTVNKGVTKDTSVKEKDKKRKGKIFLNITIMK